MSPVPARHAALAVALSIIAAIPLAGCGERQEPTRLPRPQATELVLDGEPGSRHAGIYQALASGHFAGVGLEVRAGPPPRGSTALEELGAGRADLALASEPEVFLARQRGLDVVAVANLAPRALTPTEAAPRRLSRILRHAGVARKVARRAASAPSWDELVLVAPGRRIATRPERTRLFIAALAQGTRAALRDPAGAARAVVRANPDLRPRAARRELRLILPALRPVPGRRFGFLETRRWEAFGGWMVDEGVLPARQRVASVLTNRFLPGGRIG